jgi:hypothetical protein
MSMCMIMCREALMKTARVQVLTTPKFRDWLRKEAKSAGVSVGELIRTRCENNSGQHAPTEEEKVILEMAAQLSKEVKQARISLRTSLAEADGLLKELKNQRELRQSSRPV